jgi:hypothetical protein
MEGYGKSEIHFSGMPMLSGLGRQPTQLLWLGNLRLG